jgi:broad specificity polyphosphatase/5'/3'-nucleotidase SurE
VTGARVAEPDGGRTGDDTLGNVVAGVARGPDVARTAVVGGTVGAVSGAAEELQAVAARARITKEIAVRRTVTRDMEHLETCRKERG